MNHKLYTDQAGFTLIELMVVVIIIGILASVALPQYEKAVEKSRAAEGVVLARAIADAQEVYRLHYRKYTDDISKLDFKFPGKDSLEGIKKRPSKNTKYFSCRANGRGGDGFLSVCRRIDKSAYIAYYKSSGPGGKAYCKGDKPKGNEWCKMVTGKKEADNSGRYAF